MRGQGSVYQERDRWVAQLSIGPRGQRRYVRRTRPSRREALAALAELRNERHPPTAGRLTLSAYLAGWVRDVRNLRPATRHAYANAITYHLTPTIGEIRLSELTPLDVERMLSLVGERIGPKSLRNVHAVLRRALSMAVRQGLILRNVAAREFVDAPRVPADEPRAFSVDEVQRLLEAAKGDRLEALFITAVGTGLRQGELLGLAWEDIEIGGTEVDTRGSGAPEASGASGSESGARVRRGGKSARRDVRDLRAPLSGDHEGISGHDGREGQARLSVRRELVRRDGRYQRVELKTPQSRRAVPLSLSVAAALAEHRERVIKAGFVPTATGPVFTNTEGGPLNGSWLTHRFYALCEQAKVPRMAFHRLRGTYASRLAEAGVSELQIARLLGHSRTTVTKQRYIAPGETPAAALDAVERMIVNG